MTFYWWIGCPHGLGKGFSPSMLVVKIRHLTFHGNNFHSKIISKPLHEFHHAHACFVDDNLLQFVEAIVNFDSRKTFVACCNQFLDEIVHVRWLCFLRIVSIAVARRITLQFLFTWPYPGQWSKRNRFPTEMGRGSLCMILHSLPLHTQFHPPASHTLFHTPP